MTDAVMLKLKPTVEGQKVPFPGAPGRYLAADGEDVPDNAWWRVLLSHGDVTDMEAESKAAQQNEAAAVAQHAERTRHDSLQTKPAT